MVMKHAKLSRRSFLKAGAAASVAGLVAANAAAASAAEPKAAAAQENGLLDGLFGGKTPKYIFLFIGDGMGLHNMKRYSDEMTIDAEVGKGKTVTVKINIA